MLSTVILLADNDPEFLETRGERLVREGFQVRVASGVAEARRLLEQDRIDLAILDLRLVNDTDDHDVSGIELAKQVAPEVPKIILTNYPNWQAVVAALKEQLNGVIPAVDFVAKQDGAQALITAVRKVLQRGQKRPNQKHVQPLKVVVASPSDVQAERDSLDTVAAELNRGIADMCGLRIEIARWETDAFPGFHLNGPQALIDSILRIDEADLVMGIFWKRFGTPVADANSGTEHELRLAYQSWQATRRPQIMVYFNQKAYTPRSKTETDQWGQVLEFQRNFPKEGLWWSYNGKADFETLVRNHLTQFIRQRCTGLNKAA